LRKQSFALFDIQMLTPITMQLGGVNIARGVYLERLAQATGRNCTFGA
jgi:Leu/Phe-tRNA-protein transferase